VRIVDTEESAALNSAYRQKDGPTNVLSFPFEAPPEIDDNHLGDLVMCAPVIAQEAEAQDKPPTEHWAHMLIHGVLHLRGYDHIKAEQAEVMEALEIQLLESLDIPNPYQPRTH
jgi:probable rRNA maturation factor